MKRFSFLLLACLFLLTACGNASTLAPSTSGQQTSTIITAVGKFQEYALPQNASGLMRPILDRQGQLWFGEMSRNYLGSFNPLTGKFWQQTPPNGKSGIMGMAVAPDNTIWFAEQYANYIGHYFPQTGQYKVHPLPDVKTLDTNNSGPTVSLPAAPNDLVLDKQGFLWFTEMNANAIGCLNTANGSLRQYPLSSAKNAQPLDPYGITIDPQGQIWFTEANNTQLGQLHPDSGKISYFTPPGVTTPLMEVTSDAQGQIWATNFETGTLLNFNPNGAHFTTYIVPAPGGNAGGIYGLTIAANGDVWLAVTSENMLARFVVKTQQFLSYAIPTSGSQPIGLVEANNGKIWFTESGSNKIGMLQP